LQLGVEMFFDQVSEGDFIANRFHRFVAERDIERLGFIRVGTNERFEIFFAGITYARSPDLITPGVIVSGCAR